MRIQVKRIYQGKSINGNVILPGVYEADDVRLFGMTDFLVANKFAVVMDAPVAKVADPEPVKEVKPAFKAKSKKESSNDDAK